MTRLGHAISPRTPEKGFVLIYVAAILLLLVGLVMVGAREIRKEGRLSAALQDQLVARNTLLAAATLVKARMEMLHVPQSESANDLLGLASRATEGVMRDHADLTVSFEDADLRPDANGLTVEEWARLLGAYGMVEPYATDMARRLEQTRRDQGGFESALDIEGDYRLPRLLRLGDESDNQYPPLARLLSVSGGGKRLHVDYSPLPLFVSLLGATSEQIERLRDARKSRRLKVADAELIFGGSARAVCNDGEPTRMRVRLAALRAPVVAEFEFSVVQGRLRTGTSRVQNASP